MARKRIKTLATDWGFPVEDLLAGCVRLKLGHTHSESSLLSIEEADRLKADLDQQAHRETILRRETVLETSTGKILEKRLNATVMRRRHTEPGQSAANTETPFHFEVESRSGDEQFVSPFLDESPEPKFETPVFGGTEPEAAPEPKLQEHAPMSHAEIRAAAETHEPEMESQAEAMAQYSHPEPEPEPETEIAPEVEPAPVIELVAPVAPEPSAPAAPSSRFGYRTDRVRAVETGRGAINLTRGSQLGPTLDDGQKGPKVLGRIDLRPKAVVRPATPASRPGGAPASRPGLTGRFAPQQQTPQTPA